MLPPSLPPSLPSSLCPLLGTAGAMLSVSLPYHPAAVVIVANMGIGEGVSGREGERENRSGGVLLTILLVRVLV